VRVVGENDLDTLPSEVLQQILNRAVEEERYELAVKVRDAINNKKDGE
jgi:protein-arginine kinase activator protein McsA